VGPVPGDEDASHESNYTPLCRVGVKNACARSSAGLDGVVLKHSDC